MKIKIIILKGEKYSCGIYKKSLNIFSIYPIAIINLIKFKYFYRKLMQKMLISFVKEI